MSKEPKEKQIFAVSPKYRPVDGQPSKALQERFRKTPLAVVETFLRVVATLILGSVTMLIMLVLSPLRMLHPMLKKRGVKRMSLPIDFIQRVWARFMLFLFGVEVTVHYEDKVPTEKPILLMFSHSSGIDPFVVIAHSPASVRFVAKKSILFVPLFGITGYLYGHVYIDRQNRSSAIDSLNQAASAITDRNTSVAISPEGTRSNDGSLAPFKKGPFHLARQVNCTIVPLVIYDALPCWHPKGLWPIPTTSRKGQPVRLLFGEPIHPDQEGKHKSIEELSEAVRSSMVDVIQRYESDVAKKSN